jgi:hypothetical protein
MLPDHELAIELAEVTLTNSDFQSIAADMCYYEKITFVTCGHQEKRLTQYCHFARNDPGHQCFGAWRWSREWEQFDTKCGRCTQSDQHYIATSANRNTQ